ncbi:Protein kinase, ATP binding site-containing protein [Artemisia annua]|uniref:Protein kinase, ATP binding site-containing protein n=1 Tax=Artemisia annua TaxID=35608 RepID=A0A2U1LRF5_ARTAN|nr:Protein kinase, ATP binding site-containing protein [Artemisia annua]
MDKIYALLLQLERGLGAIIKSTSSGAWKVEVDKFYALLLHLKRELGAMIKSTSSEALKVQMEKFNALLPHLEKELGAMVKSTSSGAWKANKFEHLRIRLIDIQLATNHFSKESELPTNEESCSVYTGDLECFDREYVSSLEDKNKGELPKRRYNNVRIKCINDANAEAMFHTEIEVLSTCKHQYIVSLLGFCDEGHHMILVYEGHGMNSTSLQKTLFARYPWGMRVAICYLFAVGLNYIHNEMEVIHRQISSNTIFLHDKHSIQISGFGLSTFLSSNQDEDTGHLGKNLLDPFGECYMAPEFRETGKATKESDIYSFGLVMFEMLSGIPYPHYRITDTESFKYGTLKQKVAQEIKEENYSNKLFLKKGPNEDSLDIFIKITEQCLAVNPEQRPTLQVIMTELGKAVKFQHNHKDHLRMSFKDIESATQSFGRANYIGVGGFGRVYRGELASEHGSSTIVAKRLDTRSGQGDQQFYNELLILSEYKHDNVIGLVGYNNDEQERIIVYEYASKGSLDKYLNEASLTWIIRLNICIDIARGLAFLHRVLFEILYGKSTYEIKQRENQFLQSLVKRRLEEGRLDELVFNPIKNQIVPEALATFQAIGYRCLHDDREKRPTAQHVLVQLQKALELQVKGVPGLQEFLEMIVNLGHMLRCQDEKLGG